MPSEDQHTRQRQLPGTRCLNLHNLGEQWIEKVTGVDFVPTSMEDCPEGEHLRFKARPRVENRGPGEEVPATARNDSRTSIKESTFGSAVERYSAYPTGMVPCAYAEIRDEGMVVCACSRGSRSNLQNLQDLL